MTEYNDAEPGDYITVFEDRENKCGGSVRNYWCTRGQDHEGQHVAEGGWDRVLAVINPDGTGYKDLFTEGRDYAE